GDRRGARPRRRRRRGPAALGMARQPVPRPLRAAPARAAAEGAGYAGCADGASAPDAAARRGGGGRPRLGARTPRRPARNLALGGNHARRHARCVNFAPSVTPTLRGSFYLLELLNKYGHSVARSPDPH